MRSLARQKYRKLLQEHQVGGAARPLRRIDVRLWQQLAVTVPALSGRFQQLVQPLYPVTRSDYPSRELYAMLITHSPLRTPYKLVIRRQRSLLSSTVASFPRCYSVE